MPRFGSNSLAALTHYGDGKLGVRMFEAEALKVA